MRHLAFEGGGGKGAAYLGALWALQDPEVGILQWTTDHRTKRSRLKPGRLEGIAGSSAGALTAMLLATGYNTAEIGRLIGDLGRLKTEEKTARGSYLYDEPDGRTLAVQMGAPRPGQRRDACVATPISRTQSTIAHVLNELLVEHLTWVEASPPVGLFVRQPGDYLTSLAVGKGAMSGCALRNTLDGLIAARSLDARQNPLHNLTFRQHRELHGVTLVVTGTDVETGTSRYFSADTTPELRVADGVRISMGFPFVFKPVVIPEGELKGTWIDGGALNNTPIHAFDVGGALPRSVLGLRLEVERPRKIETFKDYVEAVLGTLMSAAETLHVRTPAEKAQTIQLPIGSLSLLEFEPDPAAVQKVSREVALVVMKHFGLSRMPAPPP